jgi:hypothetical protein
MRHGRQIAVVEVELPRFPCGAESPVRATKLEQEWRGRGLRVAREPGPRPGVPVTLSVSKRYPLQVEPRELVEAEEARAGPLSEDALAQARAAAIKFAKRRGGGSATTRPRGDPIWARVFDVRTFAPIGLWLHVVDNDDAGARLDALASAMRLSALTAGLPGHDVVVRYRPITIQPPPGWLGYGHPELVPG